MTIETIRTLLTTDGPELDLRCSPAAMTALLAEINGARRASAAAEMGSVHQIDLREGTARLAVDDTLTGDAFVVMEDA